VSSKNIKNRLPRNGVSLSSQKTLETSTDFKIQGIFYSLQFQISGHGKLAEDIEKAMFPLLVHK